MSNIVIDISEPLSLKRVRVLPTGIVRVTQEYVRHFGSRSTALVRFAGGVLEFNEKDSQHLFAEAVSPNKGIALSTLWMLWKARLWGTGYAPKKQRFLLKTGYSGMWTERYLQHLKDAALNPLFFVHDLIPLTLSAPYYKHLLERYQKLFRNISELAKGVVVSSKITQEEMGAFAKELGLSCPPLVVAPLAPAPLPPPSPYPPLDKSYFVMLGTFHPRKNHLFMLNVWQQLARKYGDQTPHLVLIGQPILHRKHVSNCLRACKELEGLVSIIWGCQDQDLSTWLHHATALLFPTLAEGFGLPLVEAMATGVPVLASDLPIFREIAGNIPEYADPQNPEEWMQLIMEYAQPKSLKRKVQCERIASYSLPTWKEHFSEVESWLMQEI